MMKKYKWSLLLGSLLSLSPILIGLLLWNQLPAKLPTHFSTGNTPDGWSSKAITVFGLPLFMFAMMWFCFLFTHVDPKRQNISPKLIRALVWFMAALSPIVVCSSYAIALGINVNITLLTYLIIGLMLLVIGNYLAKTKQNRTIVLAFGFHGHCPVKKTGIAHTVSAPDCLSFVGWL